MTITFCGHSDVYDDVKVKQWLMEVTGSLIHKGAKTFYLGGYGGFDGMVKFVLTEQKKQHKHIEIVLIIPYLNRNMNTDGYDYTLYPPLETVPPKFAILKRNEWMVEQSDVVIAYITHNFGGAAKTLNYAKRKKKNVILYQSSEVIL